MIVKDGSRTHLRLRGIVVLLAAGFVGGLAGATVDRLMLSRSQPAAPAFERPPGPPGSPDRGFPAGPDRLPRSFERLDLSEEQRQRISAILESSQPRVDSIMAVMLPALRVARESVQVAIEAVLTDEQRLQLEAEFDRHPPWSPRGGWSRSGQRRGPDGSGRDRERRPRANRPD